MGDKTFKWILLWDVNAYNKKIEKYLLEKKQKEVIVFYEISRLLLFLAESKVNQKSRGYGFILDIAYIDPHPILGIPIELSDSMGHLNLSISDNHALSFYEKFIVEFFEKIPNTILINSFEKTDQKTFNNFIDVRRNSMGSLILVSQKHSFENHKTLNRVLGVS